MPIPADRIADAAHRIGVAHADLAAILAQDDFLPRPFGYRGDRLAYTAGILLLAPGWRDALARWLPRWVAEAMRGRLLPSQLLSARSSTA